MKDPTKHPAFEREAISPLMWSLLAAVVIIAGCLLLGDLYLNGRRVATDHRNEIERQGICGIIDQFPAGANVRIDQARADFRCPIPIPTAAPSQRPTPARRPKVRVTVTVTPRPVITPGLSRLIVTPGPTVTVTQRPPRHKHRKQHRTPTPTPTPTCTSVQLGGMCLP